MPKRSYMLPKIQEKRKLWQTNNFGKGALTELIWSWKDWLIRKIPTTHSSYLCDSNHILLKMDNTKFRWLYLLCFFLIIHVVCRLYLVRSLFAPVHFSLVKTLFTVGSFVVEFCVVESVFAGKILLCAHCMLLCKLSHGVCTPQSWDYNVNVKIVSRFGEFYICL